jgi:ferredoxin
MNVEVRYFSATGVSQRIAAEFTRGLGLETRYVNITLPETREINRQCEAELEVYIVPVHGERIPGFIYRYLRGIVGNGRPLVALAVYGNMGMGISLAQFDRLADETGFKLIAAGAFVGEHTFCNFGTLRQAQGPDQDQTQGAALRQAQGLDHDQTQGAVLRKAQGMINNVGKGRPDQADMVEVFYFGQQVRMKMEQKSCVRVSLPSPHMPMFIAGFPERGTRFIVRQPNADTNLCKMCGACVRGCPVGAIQSKNLEIDGSKCIRCMACVYQCPLSARRSEFKSPVIDRLFGFLGKNRRRNVFFY